VAAHPSDETETHRAGAFGRPFFFACLTTFVTGLDHKLSTDREKFVIAFVSY
jgi:hypothetical protein